METINISKYLQSSVFHLTRATVSRNMEMMRSRAVVIRTFNPILDIHRTLKD